MQRYFLLFVDLKRTILFHYLNYSAIPTLSKTFYCWTPMADVFLSHLLWRVQFFRKQPTFSAHAGDIAISLYARAVIATGITITGHIQSHIITAISWIPANQSVQSPRWALTTRKKFCTTGLLALMTVTSEDCYSVCIVKLTQQGTHTHRVCH